MRTEKQRQKHEGWTEKALPAVANQQQEPGPARLEIVTQTHAGFSDCRTYRYWLSRTWDEAKPRLVVIGLNPSTADETTDDPTIRRCIGYAKAWGMGELVMLNLFAYRATEPRHMKAATDPVGPENDAWLFRYATNSRMVLAAWGAHGSYRDRWRAVCQMLSDREIFCLGVTKDGHPKHPLYLRADAKPERLL